MTPRGHAHHMLEACLRAADAEVVDIWNWLDHLVPWGMAPTVLGFEFQLFPEDDRG